MIRIAAVGDIHYDKNAEGRLKKHLVKLKDCADIFLLAGDLTQTGDPEEAQTLAEELRLSPIPVVAVFGNHDLHLGRSSEIRNILEKTANVHVLENESICFRISGFKIGISGSIGFGGGFVGASGSEFGEEIMKNFIRYTKDLSKALQSELSKLEVDFKIALTHYSPTTQTLVGEQKEIYPFLGSYHLAEAIDRGKANIAFHGHAHRGVEKGETPGGIPVRNVAQPVIRHVFNLYSLDVKHNLQSHIPNDLYDADDALSEPSK